MEITKLRKLLKDDIKANPFNDNFNIDYLIEQVIHLNIKEIEKDPLFPLIKSILLFNGEYVNYYRVLKEAFIASNLSFTSLFEIVIIIFNRNYLVHTHKNFNKFKNKNILSIKDLMSDKITTMDPNMGKIEASSALEADVDASNYVINYIRYYNNLLPKNLGRDFEIKPLQKIHFTSQLFSVLKEVYDDSVWNGGSWEVNNSAEKPQLKVDFLDKNLLVLNKVGLTRMQNNMITQFQRVFVDIKNNTRNGLIIKSLIEDKKQKKRIKKVSFTNGIIEYELAKGFGNNEISDELRNLVIYQLNYPFLENITLNSLGNLKLVDLLKIFSLVQDLFGDVAAQRFDEGIKGIKDFQKFPVKITLKNLVKYLLMRSTYTESQVRIFLNLITNSFGERINLWDKPLIRLGEYLYVNFLPVLAPMLTNMMDNWLEQSGYKLSERGKLLEDYLRLKLSEIFLRKNIQYFILAQSKLQNKQKQYEEIDLLIILKTVVIIGEVKCIKYPVEPRDKHNSLKVVNKGVNQILRKTDFIKKWQDHLEKEIGNINGKLIIPIVITNYPIYSGYQIKDVPIIDFNLLLSYFRDGKLTSGMVHHDGKREIIKERVYYLNENEMCENLASYLKNPPPVEEVKKYYEIVEFPITPSKFRYSNKVTSAQIHDNDET